MNEKRYKLIGEAFNYFVENNSKKFDEIIEVLTEDELNYLYNELNDINGPPMTKENREAMEEGEYLLNHPELWDKYDYFKLLSKK